MKKSKPLPLNGQTLFSDLNEATDQLMSMPVEQIGSQQWQALLEQQQRSFKSCQQYLWGKASRSQPGQVAA